MFSAGPVCAHPPICPHDPSYLSWLSLWLWLHQKVQSPGHELRGQPGSLDLSTEGGTRWLIFILEGRTISMPCWGIPDSTGLLVSLGSGLWRTLLLVRGRSLLLELQIKLLGLSIMSLMWTGDLAKGWRTGGAAQIWGVRCITTVWGNGEHRPRG